LHVVWTGAGASSLDGLRMPGVEPVTLLGMPVWLAGAMAAVVAVTGLLTFRRMGYEVSRGTLGRVGAVLGAVLLVWAFLDYSRGRELAAERRAIDARATELTTRAVAPGSALACLDAMAGDTVEGSCEKAIFATPQSVAAAVSYVSAQLLLLADVGIQQRRGDKSYDALSTRLRRATEIDRFGFVAHVLALRESCTPQNCSAFALLKDERRVRLNLQERTYEQFVARHARDWPNGASQPVAANGRPDSGAARQVAVPGMPNGTTTDGLFFPSSASIPPVSIMNAEPTTPPAAPPAAPEVASRQPAPARPPAAAEPATARSQAPEAAVRPPAPARRPPPAKRPPPTDLNASAAPSGPLPLTAGPQ
jgi:hypothetical protein